MHQTTCSDAFFRSRRRDKNVCPLENFHSKLCEPVPDLLALIAYELFYTHEHVSSGTRERGILVT